MQTIKHHPNDVTTRIEHNRYRADEDTGAFYVDTVDMQTDIAIQSHRHFTRADGTMWDQVDIHVHDSQMDNPEPQVKVRTRDDGKEYVAVCYDRHRTIFLPMAAAAAIHEAVNAHIGQEET